MSDKVTCSVITPMGRGAVATVRISGERGWSIVRGLLSCRFQDRDLPTNRIVVGRWCAGVLEAELGPGPVRDTERNGEQVVAARLDESTIDIHCHGGQAAVEAIVDSLVLLGCERSDWRAMLAASQQCTIARDAAVALSSAATEKAARHLLAQYQGILATEIRQIDQQIASGEVIAASSKLEKLLRTATAGLHLCSPFHVAVCGPPNVGKSSLINALAGFERSIVFDQPGTTRDVLSVSTAIHGWPVHLLDTAGLRDVDDSNADGRIESAGIEKALVAAAAADLVVLVSDWSQPWDTSLGKWREQFPQALLVHNKSDLKQVDTRRPPGLSTSATESSDWQPLLSAIFQRLVPIEPQVGEPLLFTPEQVELLTSAMLALGED